MEKFGPEGAASKGFNKLSSLQKASLGMSSTHATQRMIFWNDAVVWIPLAPESPVILILHPILPIDKLTVHCINHKKLKCIY